MKEVKKEITVYITDDGAEFTSKFQAANYEKELVFTNKRKKFLEEKLNELIGLENVRAKITNLKSSSSANTKIEYQPYQLDKDDGWYEPDESMPVDWDKWHHIEEEMEIKYGFKPNIPYWYWPK